MKPSTVLVLTLLLTGFESAAFAFDIPVPRPNAKPDAKSDVNENAAEKKYAEPIKKLAEPQRFSIRIDEETKVAKLVIPNSVIRALQADGAKSGSIFPSTQNDIQPLMTRTGTVVGGALMTLAAIFGGLWFVRSRKATAPTFAAMASLVLLCGIGTASFVYANAGPPPEARSLTSKILKYGFTYGEVQVETTNDADQIVLVLPRAK
jgi:hypothetical protein